MDLTRMKNRILLFISGIFILTFGVALIIKADLGVGSWDSVNVGLSNKFGLSVGTFAFLVAIIMTIIAGIIRGGKFKFYTLCTAFILSGCTDFWLLILKDVSMSNEIIVKIICFLIGMVISSAGLAVYLTPNLAPNSLDDCMMAFKEKFNLSVGMAKLIADSIGIIFALLASGPIGIGTIIITFSVGPLINVFYSRLNSIFKIVN